LEKADRAQRRKRRNYNEPKRLKAEEMFKNENAA
jgi:hypothetical protein